MATTDHSSGFNFYIHTGIAISYHLFDEDDTDGTPGGYGWDVMVLWDNLHEGAKEGAVHPVLGNTFTQSDPLGPGDDHETALLETILAARNAIRTLNLKIDPYPEVPGSGGGFLYGASDDHSAGWWGEDFPADGHLSEAEAKAIIERVCSSRGWEHHDLAAVS